MWTLRRKVWLMVFFILGLLFVGKQIYQIYIQEFPNTPRPPRPKVKVLVIGLGRSGSTFLGKFFRENKDVHYLYEPVKTTRLVNRGDKSLQLLNDIYHCNRPDNIYLDYLIRNLPSTIRDTNLFPRHKKGMPKSFNRSSLAAAIQERCKQMRVIATKILIDNLPDRDSLRSIKTLLDTHKDLKIIYLVRDPWRVFYSRKVLDWYHGEVYRDNVKPICETNWKSMQYIKNNSLNVKDRAKLVVYTEMVTRPFDVINDLYAFLDISPVPWYMYTWILKETKGSSKIFRGNYNPYNTHRNTTEVLGRKTNFTQEESNVIKEDCHDVIEFIQQYKKNHDLL